MTVPADVAIDLHRNRLDTVTVPVTVTSNVAWDLSVADLYAGPHRGHMASAGTPTHVLASVMVVRVPPDVRRSLDQAAADVIVSGVDDAVISVELDQFIAPVDPPGVYRITVVFHVTSTF